MRLQCRNDGKALLYCQAYPTFRKCQAQALLKLAKWAVLENGVVGASEPARTWWRFGNALRPETTPMEYARQIKRIMQGRPQADLAEIGARILHKSPGWLATIIGRATQRPRWRPQTTKQVILDLPFRRAPSVRLVRLQGNR